MLRALSWLMNDYMVKTDFEKYKKCMKTIKEPEILEDIDYRFTQSPLLPSKKILHIIIN